MENKQINQKTNPHISLVEIEIVYENKQRMCATTIQMNAFIHAFWKTLY